jgi:hypothetical protein
MSVPHNHPQWIAQTYYESANFWGETMIDSTKHGNRSATLKAVGINTLSLEQWNVKSYNELEMKNEWEGQEFFCKHFLENVYFGNSIKDGAQH